MSRFSSLVSRCALVLGAVFAVQASTALAQSQGPNDNEPVVRTPKRTFRLWGLADAAVTGMRQGGNSWWHTTNSGPADDNPSVPWNLPGRVIGTNNSPNGYCCGYFELQIWMGAARSDWSKNRDVAPSLENVKGSGWVASTNLARWVPDNLWAFSGRDGSVGTLFSGKTSSDDGSCRDNRANANSQVSAGVPLLAGSDCPPTWVDSTRFAGERMVADTTFLRYFQSNPAAFTFDDHRIPASERVDKIYGSFQTFGAANDFGRERLRRFGNVIPGGTGGAQIEGYPMGIEWDFNAWTYQVPTIADAMFWKVYIVNKSAEVYGVGLDYDSLYLGFQTRPFHTVSSQVPSVYAVPQKGAVYSAQSNINTQNCFGSVHGANVTGGYTAGTGIRSCLSNTSSDRGFRGGAGGMLIFQSPIGDLRNKKFSDPASPFYFPAHPHAGDTLTYNMINACGFSCAAASGQFGGSARAAFGAIANIEADALAGLGKASGDLTNLQYFDLFHNQDWPLRWSPATGNTGGYNKYVPPGNWDYNKDGILDTLKVLTCSPGGCETPWVDTLPGGWPNSVHNNYFVGVGPIKLKAGDTTSFTVAWLSSPDSISLEATMNNLSALYQSFWLSPEPPIAPNIVSAVPTGGNRQYDTFIRLFLDQSANTQTDKFLFEQAKALKADTGIINRTLKFYNPRLPNQILARALTRGTILVDTVPRDTLTAGISRTPPAAAIFTGCRTAYSAALCQIVTDTAIGVVDSLFVFKSCDLGLTFTASSGTSCVPSPSRDVSGAAPRYPWQAYAKLARDASGNFPSTVTDGGVTGGLSYTYVITAQSFPASFTINKLVGGAMTQGTYTIRPATLNGLTTNTANRNVAVVYVPASRQSSSDSSLVTIGAMPGDTIAAFSISARLGKPVRDTANLLGRIVVSDSAEVTTFDADTTVAGITSTKVKLFFLADTGFNGVAPAFTTPKRVSYRVDTFFVNETASSVDIAGKRLTLLRKDSVSATPGNKAKWTFWRYVGRGPQMAVYEKSRPLFITDTFPTNNDITPGATIARPDFKGLLVTFSPTVQRTLRSTWWTAPGIGLLNSPAFPTISWTGGTARDQVVSFSRYRFTFSGKEFGPYSPFTIDRANPGALNSQYATSLAARASAQISDVSAATAGALTRALGRTITTDSLALLSLPFTVSNLKINRQVTIAVLKSEHPVNALLGLGGDTIRVDVPAGQWIPGDRLYFVETFTTFRTDTLTASPLRERVKFAAGTADTATVTRVTWGPGNLACGTPSTCNPIKGIGGTGFTAVGVNEQYDILYFTPFGGNVFQPGTGLYAFNYTIAPERSGRQLASTAKPNLSLVNVVPNPYIMYSQYEQTSQVKRLLFTHLPPSGSIRIYTASGQFVQQLNWTPGDLERNCTATVSTTACQSTGDLFWNMRTREDLEVGPGFYVYVVSTSVNGKKQDKLGKFVVIH